MMERRPYWWLPVGLVAVISLPSYSADSRIPALLQFAEQYQNPNVISDMPKTGTKVPPVPVSKPAQNETTKKTQQFDDSLRLNLRHKEQQLQRQQAEIKALRNQLAVLKAESLAKPKVEKKPEVAVTPKEEPKLNVSGLTQLIQGVRQGLQRPPDQQKVADLLAAARQERSKALAEVEQVKRDNQVLKQRMEQLQSQADKDVVVSQDSADKKIQSLSRQLSDLQKQHQQTQDQFDTLQKEHTQALNNAKQAQQDNQVLSQRLNELQSKNDKDVVAAKNNEQKNTQSLTKELQDAQKQRQQAEEQLATALAGAKQTQQENQSLHQQLNDLKLKADKDVATAQNTLQTANQSLTKQLQAAKTQQQQTAEQLAAEQKDRAQALADGKQAQQDVLSLRQQLTVLQSKSDKDVVAAQTSLEKTTQSLTKQLQAAKTQQQQTAEQLAAEQKDRAQALADAKQAQLDVQSLRQQLTDLQSKADKDVVTAQTSLEKTTQVLTKQLQAAKTQQQQTAEQLAAEQKDRAQTLADAKQAQQDVQSLRQQLTDLQSKADKDLAAAQKGAETAQASLTKALQAAKTQQQQTAEQLAAEQKDRAQALADAKQAQLDVQSARQQLTVLQSKSDKDVVAAQTSLEKTTQVLTKELQTAKTQQQQTAEQLAAEQKDRAQALADAKQAQQDVQSLHQQLTDLQSKADTDLAAAQKGTETATASLSKELQEAQNLQQKLLGQLAEKDKALAQLEKDAKGLKDEVALLQPEVKMTTPMQKQSYAAGIALGKNVLEVQAEQASIGVPTDRKLLLTGIVDSFSGHYKLKPDALAKAMSETDKEVIQAKKKNTTRQKTISESYLSKFSKKKGSQKSDSGFWYHIDYAGDEKIPADAVLDVVVQESLTDGTIIQDMDVNGSVISQSLDRYPPLFREAISKLNNHGTITIVVPPEMAYGDKGYPPKVPPNATMIYVIRVVDVIPVKK